MEENNITQIKRDLEQIADMLLLNGTLTECPGLVNGKMGIAVFFFHYAQFTGKELFADYAMDVIGEMLGQIHVNSPADYEKGIAGIGVGMDYLIQNNFLDVEDDICEDFDQRMVRAVKYDPWQDFSLYNGLTGYGRYWMTRLHYQAPAVWAKECLLYIMAQIGGNLPDISVDEQMDVYSFLSDLQMVPEFESSVKLLEQCRKKWNLQSTAVSFGFPRLSGSVAGNIIQACQCKRYFNIDLQDVIDTGLKQITDLDREKAPTGSGLLTGYAGEGMLRLTALDRTNISWMCLL